jgi:hypothetical protein
VKTSSGIASTDWATSAALNSRHGSSIMTHTLSRHNRARHNSKDPYFTFLFNTRVAGLVSDEGLTPPMTNPVPELVASRQFGFSDISFVITSRTVRLSAVRLPDASKFILVCAANSSSCSTPPPHSTIAAAEQVLLWLQFNLVIVYPRTVCNPNSSHVIRGFWQ